MTGVDASTPVLVLEAHHGSLGIARSLGRWGVPVYAVARDPENPALTSKYFRGWFRWDFNRASHEASLQFLVAAGRRLGGGAVLIPTSDALAELVADHAAILSEHFVFPRVEPELVRALSNKRQLYYMARRLGIPTPETVFPTSRSEVAAFASDARFPVLLKAADGLRMEARTGQKMVIVHTAEEMLRQYDALEDPEQPDLMIQEYIPGGDDTIWMFEGYFDEFSNCVAGFTGRKLRQHPVHRGATSLGILEPNEKVAGTTRSFMRRIGYRGILDIGYRYDARDGGYKLLDPNPRIGSTFRLFVGSGDVDVVRLLYLDMTGQPLPETSPRWGRKWLIEDQDFFSCMDYVREGALTPGGWLGSLRGVEETAWFARDDLVPFRRVCGRVARRVVRGFVKRIRGRGRAAGTAAEDHATLPQARSGGHRLSYRSIPAVARREGRDHPLPSRQ